MSTPFRYRSGRLCVSETPLDEIATRYGTPLYVYHPPTVGERIDAVRAAFEGVSCRICYSVKANANLRLLKWLADRGVGFDVVSGGELSRLQVVGVGGDRIVFAGVGKSDAELVQAIDSDLWMVTIESVEEAEALARLARERDREGVPVALRINPDVDARTHPHITTGRGADKFGLSEAEFERALDVVLGSKTLELVALHMHLGSQITDLSPYREGLGILERSVEHVRSRGVDLRWVNAGGGFGISYDGHPVPSPDDFASAILPAARRIGVELILELGRALVGPAGCLVATVVARKSRGEKDILILDAGMTDLVRPALYGARHRVLPLAEAEPAPGVVDLAGPICESTDFLARNRQLPPLGKGDLVAILDAGAYGMAMASQYNTHPRPAEVWVTDEGEIETIRRRETVEDLLSIEREAL